MIFSAPRFVVVDDREHHLKAITDTFQLLGAPCMGIKYDPADELNKGHFRGVRCLFMDLHLIDGQKSSDERRHYALIASILEENINKNGGPFVLIVWTAYEHLSTQLRDYLDQSMDETKPYARPLAVLGLAKESFINVEDGTINDPSALRNAVQQSITSNPQLAALLGWEVDVLGAAGDTLASLLNLVPLSERGSARFPSALDTILSRLTKEAVGANHVDVNPRIAITNALAPILTDRILNQAITPETQDTWKCAVTRHQDKTLQTASPLEAGEINRMLHLAIPGAETLLPTDWGAVVSWPFEWDDDNCRRITGMTIKQMLCEQFRLRSSAIAVCRPILFRVGAACDYAQSNQGPITFLFGLDIPESAERQLKDDKPVKLTDAIWRSPVFVVPGATEPSRLHAHIRFPQIYLPDSCSEWEVFCRLREQLLMHLISSASNYVSRPGVVQLPVE